MELEARGVAVIHPRWDDPHAPWERCDLVIPRTTWDQWGALPKVPFDQLAPGDLVFFRNLGHMGMYIGDGNVLHAPQTGKVVSVFPLARRMHDYVGAASPDEHRGDAAEPHR